MLRVEWAPARPALHNNPERKKFCSRWAYNGFTIRVRMIHRELHGKTKTSNTKSACFYAA